MRIVADSWYAAEIPGARVLDDRIPAPFRRICARSGVARGVALFLAGRKADVIVTTNPQRGATVCTILCGLFGRRKMVLLEYIVHPPSRRSPLRRVYFGLVRRKLLGRALLRAQVLSAHEARTYPAVHGIPASRFSFLRWPGRYDHSPLPQRTEGNRVLASGKRTDWATFFAAARGAGWDVHAVCTAADLPAVRELSAGMTVAIQHDISADEHQAEVDAATVYVIPVKETGASIGQIRVMNAAQAGVPVVASNVVGLADYVDHTSAVLVPPGDATALRNAIDELLADPSRREALRIEARRIGGTMADYIENVGKIIDTAADQA